MLPARRRPRARPRHPPGAWSDVCELSVDGGALRVHMHEPDDDLRLSLGYPALLIAAVAAAYLRGAVPLSRV